MCIEHWWNDSEKRKPKYSEKSCYTVQHKRHTDWPVLEPVSPRSKVVIPCKLTHLLWQFFDYQTTFNELVPSRDVPVHNTHTWPSLRINSSSEPTTFAYDSSVIISNKTFDDFCTVSNLLLSHISKLLTARKMALTLATTNTIKAITNNSPHHAVSIGYTEKTVNTNFLGLQTDNRLNWKNHVGQMLPNLSRQLGRWSVSATLPLSNQFLSLIVTCNKSRNTLLEQFI